MKKKQLLSKRNSQWMNLRNFTLFGILIMCAWLIYSCKPKIEPDPINEAGNSPFTSYAINFPNQPVALIIQNELATESITISANRTTNGNFKQATSILFYDATEKMAANVKLGKDYLIDEIEAISEDTKTVATFSNYNLLAGTVRIKIIDANTNEFIAEDQEIKLTPEMITNLNDLKSLNERDGKGLRIAAGSCDFKAVTSTIQSLASCLQKISVIASRVIPCVGLIRPNLILIASALWCVGRQTAGQRNNALRALQQCDKLRNKIEENYGSCKEEAKEQLDKVKNQLNKMKCVVNNLKGINSFNDLKKKYDECSNDPNTMPANTWGDPHLNTFDGFAYDFHASGEFIAVKSTTDNFEMQVRQLGTEFGNISYNSGFAVQTGSDVVCVISDKLYVNNKPQTTNFTTLDLKEGASLSITKDKNGSNILNIKSKYGDLVSVPLNFNSYSVRLNESRKGKVIGLFGNFDGNKENDLRLKNDEVIVLDDYKNNSISVQIPFNKIYPVYADNWRIEQKNSLFYYEGGKNTDSFTKKDYPSASVIITSEKRIWAEGVCKAAGVNSEPYLSACITDVAITNDTKLASASLWMQQNESRTNLLQATIIQEAVNVKRITTFGVSSYILKSDGTLWASGWNDHGRFGIGSTTLNNKNLFIKIMDGIKDIASGNSANHMLFLKNDNTIWVSGYNVFGQTGNGATNGANVLTAVKIMDDSKALAIGSYSSFIIKNDNSLWAFGNGVNLINGTINSVYLPTKVMSDVRDISVGGGHVLILKTDNTLWGSGSNTFGQLSQNSAYDYFPAIKLMDNVKSMGTGNEISLVVKNDNTLWGAGYNRFGELGNGTNTKQLGFAKIMNDVQSVSVGDAYSLILKTDNTLWGTGYNNSGQLGDGTKTDKKTFVKVNSSVKYLSTGGRTTFVVKEDNTVWASGYNLTGKLGDGTTFERLNFVPINVK